MKLTRWSKAQGEPELNALISRLKDEGLEPVVMSSHPGKQYPTHTHSNSQVRWVISGNLRVGARIIEANGRPVPKDLQWVELNMGSGDRLELPSDTEHWIQLGPQGATYLLANRKD